MLVLQLLLMVVVTVMQLKRMLRDGAAVTPVFVAAAVRQVRVARLGAVEAVVPLAVDVDEPGAVLRLDRL